jgi:hypothetical protein
MENLEMNLTKDDSEKDKTDATNEVLLSDIKDTLGNDREIDVQELKVDFNYYKLLRRILLPFILTGAPIDHYLKSRDMKKFSCLSRSGILKVRFLYNFYDIFKLFIAIITVVFFWNNYFSSFIMWLLVIESFV